MFWTDQGVGEAEQGYVNRRKKSRLEKPLASPRGVNAKGTQKREIVRKNSRKGRYPKKSIRTSTGI